MSQDTVVDSPRKERTNIFKKDTEGNVVGFPEKVFVLITTHGSIPVKKTGIVRTV